jgi:hypothetical protein
MPVAGINIMSVNIKREGNFSGPYQMNCNTSIRAVYSDERGKPIADIVVVGDVLVLDEKNEQILKEWKSEKKISESMTVQIMNIFMRDVLTRTVQATDLLRLPMPLPMPAITVEQPNQEKKK